jgi:hypothetical protein
MAFADPQTINSISAPRVSSGVNTGSFQSSDGLTQLSVAHSYGKRIRRTIRYTDAKVAADPLISAQNIRYSASVYMVVDLPDGGYTVAQAKALVDALVAYLAASSGAKVTQLLGGEN